MSWSDVYSRIPSARARRTLLKVCAALLVLLVLPAHGAAQTGTVAGTVTDATTGRGLGAAQVFVVGTQIGSLADGDGRYLILGVPAGTHEVQVMLVGYPTETQEVTVVADQSAVVDFALTPRAIDMDEIVVTGTGRRRRPPGGRQQHLGHQRRGCPRARHQDDGRRPRGQRHRPGHPLHRRRRRLRRHHPHPRGELHHAGERASHLRGRHPGLQWPLHTPQVRASAGPHDREHPRSAELAAERHQPGGRCARRGHQGSGRHDAVRHRGSRGRHPDLHQVRGRSPAGRYGLGREDHAGRLPPPGPVGTAWTTLGGLVQHLRPGIRGDLPRSVAGLWIFPGVQPVGPRAAR